jgi:hypothetical protein
MDTNLKKRKASQKEAANKQRSKYLDWEHWHICVFCKVKSRVMH